MRIRPRGGSRAGARESAAPFPLVDSRAARVPFVDDDPGLLTLLRTTFELRAAVLLLDDHGSIPCGTRGKVVGRFLLREGRRYLVKFEDGYGVVETHPNELILADLDATELEAASPASGLATGRGSTRLPRRASGRS